MFTFTLRILKSVIEYHGQNVSAYLAAKIAQIKINLKSFNPEAHIVSEAIKLAKLAKADRSVYDTLPRPSLTNSKMNLLAKLLGIFQTTVLSFDLLAGRTCKWADICRAHVAIKDGHRRVIDGKKAQFRCYAAKLEAAFGEAYNLHLHNTNIVQAYTKSGDVDGLAIVILAGILVSAPTMIKKGGVIRVHSSGDFISDVYMQAWVKIAQVMPQFIMFGYSKGPEVVQALNREANIFFIHSDGSTKDTEARQMGLSQSFVKLHEGQFVGMPVACESPNSPDDFMHVLNGTSFALDFH